MHKCPSEVEWKKISFQPILSIMDSIHLINCEKLQIPEHLHVEGIRQFQIIINFRNNLDLDLINNILEHSGISWDSLDNKEKIIYGGSVFRVPGKKGYYSLNAPCIDCYINENSTSERRVILSVL